MAGTLRGAWRSRPGSRAPPSATATRPPLVAGGAHADLRRAARRRRTPRRAGCTRARRRARATAWASRCRRGAAFAVALHGCLRLGAVAVPVDLRLGERGARRARRRLRRHGRRAARRPARRTRRSPATHDLDAVADRRPHVGHDRTGRAIELTYGNWLWSALGRPSRSASTRGALAVRAAARARRRPVDPPALARSTARRRSCTERFDPSGRSTSSRDRATLVSLVPTTARRGCSTPGCASRRGCAPCCSAAGRSRPRCSSARRRRACPSCRPTA